MGRVRSRYEKTPRLHDRERWRYVYGFYGSAEKAVFLQEIDGRKIRKEQLDAILEAGRLAPTAKNLQEQKIYVVQSDEGLEKIDRITPCRYGAGTVLLVAFDREKRLCISGRKNAIPA